MMAVEENEEDSKASLSSWWARCLLSFSLLQTLNEIWSEKLSIILSPEENYEWSGIKDGKFLLNLLAILTKWLLIRECCQLVRESRCMKFWDVDTLLWRSMREHTRWLGSSLCTHSCDLPPSFWRLSSLQTVDLVFLHFKRYRTNDIIQHGHHMLTSCPTHGRLG